jgi:hypothetical protein
MPYPSIQPCFHSDFAFPRNADSLFTMLLRIAACFRYDRFGIFPVFGAPDLIWLL